jgi:hypothetical protein
MSPTLLFPALIPTIYPWFEKMGVKRKNAYLVSRAKDALPEGTPIPERSLTQQAQRERARQASRSFFRAIFRAFDSPCWARNNSIPTVAFMLRETVSV